MFRYLAPVGLLLGLVQGAQAVPVQWTTAAGGNGNFYEYVSTPQNWITAFTSAGNLSLNGEDGYLANVTSQAEHDFLLTLLPENDQAWLGGVRSRQSGLWQWQDGPDIGVAFYGDEGPIDGQFSLFNEPPPPIGDNFLDYLEIGAGPNGEWGAEDGFFQGVSQGFFVEFGEGELPMVPLPASALLLLGGLGTFRIVRRTT